MNRKIPISNLYYMLCYAWDVLREKDIVQVDFPDNYSMFELLVKVLNSGTSYLIRKGMSRGYVEKTDEIRGVKGKIDFKNSLDNLSFQNARCVCEYDDFTYDILHNRILKSTFDKIRCSSLLKNDLKKEVLITARYFSDIRSTVVNRKTVKSVHLNRNNHLYKFLLNICLLLVENLSIDERSGKAQFKDFVEDEAKMAKLFEEFVRNFYKKNLPNKYPSEKIRVSSEIIGWEQDPEFVVDQESKRLLPIMKTDISVWIGTRKVIIDTKYYKEAVKFGSYGERLSSANLYQLFAYLQNNEQLTPVGKRAEGILLYPTVTKDLNCEYRIKGHIMRVKTVNLGKESWKDIESELLAIV